MRNISRLILLVLTLTYIHCDEDTSECESKSGTSAKDCKNLNVTDGYAHCCYLDAKSDEGSIKICTELLESEYKDIEKYIKDAEKEAELVHGKINKLDCSSYYIKITLLSLMILCL